MHVTIAQAQFTGTTLSAVKSFIVQAQDVLLKFDAKNAQVLLDRAQCYKKITAVNHERS